jgi:hypothetical protein
VDEITSLVIGVKSLVFDEKLNGSGVDETSGSVVGVNPLLSDDKLDDSRVNEAMAETELAPPLFCPTHCWASTLSLMSVTAAFSAYKPPATFTPSFSEIEVSARMFPTKSDLVPNVAELPTCQKTLHAFAPLISTTDDAAAVTSVEPI